MSKTISDIKQSLTSLFHGASLDKVDDINNLLGDAQKIVVAKIDIPETITNTLLEDTSTDVFVTRQYGEEFTIFNAPENIKRDITAFDDDGEIGYFVEDTGGQKYIIVEDYTGPVYLRYYRKSFIKNESDEFIDKPEKDTNEVVLNDTAYLIYLYESALMVAQEIDSEGSGSDRDEFKKLLFGDKGNLKDDPGLYSIHHRDDKSKKKLKSKYYYKIN